VRNWGCVHAIFFKKSECSECVLSKGLGWTSCPQHGQERLQWHGQPLKGNLSDGVKVTAEGTTTEPAEERR